ncbi:MAG: homoserine O-acetyltransferase [Rickettsiales bacterium]|nr:homoserine O-acetyltransferase [Rickettsiales bacterium]
MKSKFGPNRKEFEIGDVIYLAKEKPLKLSNGSCISNFPLAFQTYGQLNKNKSNAILICHALTGDQYVASKNPVTNKEGWWDYMVGKGKPIDTDKFFVIATNSIGSCMGSWGPSSINPDTKKPYGVDFPIITINDMVNAQNLLIEEYGIQKLHAVIGGSFGGMQVLSWANLYPHKLTLAIPIATSYRYSPQNIGFHEVARQAIMADKGWNQGKYLEKNTYPSSGLAVARMTAHITYLSEESLHNKFGRGLQNKKNLSFSFDKDFKIESYLHHQGYKFIERFDANSYLYITKATDYFDLETDYDGKLGEAFINFGKVKGNKICIIAFSDDWLFPPTESQKLTKALISCQVDTSFVTIDSQSGHDSFLIENEPLKEAIEHFLNQ